jgi:hypothetical protein
LKQLEAFGTYNRKVQEVQRAVMTIIGRGQLGPMGGQFGGRGGFGGGPMAEPGTYTVKLTVNGKTYSGKVAVRADPVLAERP